MSISFRVAKTHCCTGRLGRPESGRKVCERFLKPRSHQSEWHRRLIAALLFFVPDPTHPLLHRACNYDIVARCIYVVKKVREKLWVGLFMSQFSSQNPIEKVYT